ncbi:cation-translocating P-type ATPase [Spiroplasma endosymbiont of Polydrusus pterygomalis]|uniref:cation-translocating P-type ATPase n=1 Tax=Spiroplasma endosymbiont of Polydrusus pterygomalis TaxID=3139327 RepID=UPI003CCABF2D
MIWNDTTKELAKKLNTDFVTGLTEEAAAQLLIETGPNQLPTTKKKPIWKIVLAHFIEPFVLVLIALAIIATVIGQWQEAVVVFLIVIVDATLATCQEVKAVASLDSLKKLVSSQAVVIRNGNKYDIDAKDLVIGDLVYLDAGMFVPADLRVIQSYNLRTNESLLTGESTLVNKTAEALTEKKLSIGERTNLAFMSTTVATGSGLGLVYATAKNSEIGKITTLLQEEKEPKSPLTQQMSFLIRIISIFALLLGLAMFLLQFLLIKVPVASALIFGIALTIAVIPEGLQVIVTVSLSLGSSRMAKKHAIVKHLPAVETLGQVDIICSDKTGTLTQNKMTVKKYYLTKSVNDSNAFKKQTKQEQLFLDCLVLCNNSSVSTNKTVGDPTEVALMNWSETLNFSTKKLITKYPRIYEIPFDSNRKLMSTIHEYDKEKYVFVKGAVDNMINMCSHALINNERVGLTAQIKQQIVARMDEMSNSALRVLGASYRIINNKQDYSNVSEIENNLIFLGLVGMIDPPRNEVKASLVKTKKAGIDTIMITGDHLNTAVAIGQELGLIENKTQALSGNAIDDFSEKSFNANVNQYRVFARVSPEHKVKIVKALQSHKKVVSMTGDGVNDAPSLKAADIGVAMGITGTDVAKESAQIVLTDDNFATIVDAIEEGRNIYSKIKRIVMFILITNMAQVFAIVVGAIFGWNELLQPIQILWINLIVESVIAIPMSMGPNNPGLMLEKPTNRNDRILTGSWGFIGIVSIILSALLLLVFHYLPSILHEDVNEGFIYVFVIMANAPVFYAFSFVSGANTSIINKITWKNKYIWIAAISAFAINTFIIFTPFVSDAFGIGQGFCAVDWLICIVLSTIPMWLLEMYKGIRFLFKKWFKKDVAVKENNVKTKFKKK